MLLKKLIYGNQFCGVEHTTKNNNDIFNVLHLVNKNNSLKKITSNSYNSIEESIANISKEQQVFIIINNEKVLSKKIDGVHELNKVVSIAFPNIKISDFAIEVLPQETHSFVSICRNSDVEKILDVYKKNNINVVGYSLGNTIITNITSYFSQDVIHTSNALINSGRGIILDITKSDIHNNELYDVNGLDISSSEMVNLSGILSYYSNSHTTEVNFIEKTDKLKDDFKQVKIFSNALKFGLGLVFIGLLVNFLFFSYYSDLISSLSNEQQVNERSKESLMNLTSEVKRKKNLVSDLTSSTNSKVSYYLDEIGNSIPTTILLTDIIFQPIQKNVKKDKEIEVFSNRIKISGISTNSINFLDWISLLEKKEWIDKISYPEYGVGTKSKTVFEINIKLQE
jgi:hypothetical protein